MPIPFFAHQVAVLPAKLAKPRWFDGVALVVSSIVPDLAYALLPEVRVVSHSIEGLFTWCVPMSMSLTLLVRYGLCRALVRAGVQKLVPVAEKPFDLLKLAVSAALGAFSHVVWDGIVHPDLTYRAKLSLTTSMPAWTYTLSNALGVPLGVYLFWRWWRSLPAPPPSAERPADLALRSRLFSATVLGAILGVLEYRAQWEADRTYFDFNGGVMRAAAIVLTCVLFVSLSSAFAADRDTERLS